MSQTSYQIKHLQPQPGYVVVEPAKADKKTASGLYLPDQTDDKSTNGRVLSVGGPTHIDGREVIAPVKKGDHVIFEKWGGHEIEIGDDKYQIIKFEHILAIIKK